MDFIIAMLIFAVALTIYFVYTTNLSKEDISSLNDLISDTKLVSSSLVSEGYPSNWNSNTVKRIGLTNNDQMIDKRKMNEFMEISYNKSKKLLGTAYEYLLFFVNESNDVQNIEGFCGTGGEEVNITYDISAAYYYQNREEEQFLKSFMEDEFQAVVYCDGGPKCDYLSFNDFSSGVNNYDFIVVEHPAWNTNEFNQFETAADPWLLAGGIIFFGGNMPTAQGTEAFGVTFNKKSGQSESDRLSTVVNEDEYIAFDVRDNIIFSQAYYIEDVSVGDDLIDIARFNGTNIELDDIKENGKIALARWPHGDGKILFFSDFDADYLAGDFQEILKNSAKKWSNAQCLPINISNININNLVKINRFLTYNKADEFNIVKMVLYLWL